MFKVMYVHVDVVRWDKVLKYVGVVISLTPYPSEVPRGARLSTSHERAPPPPECVEVVRLGCGGPRERQGPREGDKQ